MFCSIIRSSKVLEMDSTYLLRREGAIIKLNMGRATRSGVGTMPLFRTFATRLFLCNALPVAVTDTYESAAHRPNLVALTSAQAARIEFDHSAKNVAAKGVSFHFKGTSFTAKARKEVVLSTGTLLTPQPLELSGIGNSDVLKKHQITPKVDLPGVGEDYQDHILVSTTYEVKQGFVTYDNLGYNDTFRAATEAQYEKTHDGPMTASNSMLSYIDLYSLASSGKIAHMHRSLWEDVKKEKPTLLQKEQ
ncbi:unnamed protein product [Rhizoctonia solani]|uniref:Glucose-methanol-choline oxidoreductase N-terminal domain-containing protein n=1 Tax=Rhizoctonia solani TaxID=456999 RepID=A0A8H3H3B9_9AGAM|nr:unnamed protein product [Rhizoctonia solani]